MKYVIILPLLLLLFGCTTEPVLKDAPDMSENSQNQQNISEFLNNMFTLSYKEEMVFDEDYLALKNISRYTVYNYVEDSNKKNGFDYVANITVGILEMNSEAVLQQSQDYPEHYYLISSQNDNKNIIDDSGYWVSGKYSIMMNEHILSKNGLAGHGSSGLIVDQIMPLLDYLLSEYPSDIKLDTEYPNMDSFAIRQLDISKYVYSGYIQSETMQNNSYVKIVYYAIDNYTNIPGRSLPVIVSVIIMPSSEQAKEKLNDDYRILRGYKEPIGNQQVFFFGEDNAFFWRKDNIIFDISPAYVMPQVSNFMSADNPEYIETKEKWDYLRNRDKELILPIVGMYVNKYSPSND